MYIPTLEDFLRPIRRLKQHNKSRKKKPEHPFKKYL